MAGTEIIALGDVHVGRKTESYNTARLREKAEKYVASVLLVRRRVKLGYGAPSETVLVLLGDIVDGEEIYRGQPYEQELAVDEQIDHAAEVIGWIIRELGVTRVVAVSGNHGRANRHGKGNWDYAFYRYLDGVTAGVDFEYTPYNKMKTDIAGLNVMPWHPFEVRMYMNIPFYGLTRQGLIEAVTRGIDLALVGHFHSFFMFNVHGIDIYGNGSFLEGDEFSKLRGWVCDSRYWYLYARNGEIHAASIINAGCRE